MAINSNRIVPVVATDLITLYGNIMKLAGTSVTKADATEVGVFELTSGSGNIICSEPVKSLDFGEAVTSAKVYFIPSYDYEGFSIDGTVASPSGAEVDADGCTLYTATLSTGAITIAKVGF